MDFSFFEDLSCACAVYRAVNNGEDFRFLYFNSCAEKLDGINRKDFIDDLLTEMFTDARKMGLVDAFKRVHENWIPEVLPLSFKFCKMSPVINSWRGT